MALCMLPVLKRDIVRNPIWHWCIGWKIKSYPKCVWHRGMGSAQFWIFLFSQTRGSPGHMEIGLDLWGPICLKTLLGIIMSAFVSLRMFWMWIILSTFLHYRFTKLTSSQLLFMKHIQFEVLLMTIYEPALKTTCIELLCFLYVSPYDLNFNGKYVMLFFILCGWITCWELCFLITSSRLLSFPQPLQTAHNSMEDLQSAFFFRLMNKFFLQISACKAVSIRSRIYP